MENKADENNEKLKIHVLEHMLRLFDAACQCVNEAFDTNYSRKNVRLLLTTAQTGDNDIPDFIHEYFPENMINI